MLETDTKNLFW